MSFLNRFTLGNKRYQSNAFDQAVAVLFILGLRIPYESIGCENLWLSLVDINFVGMVLLICLDRSGEYGGEPNLEGKKIHSSNKSKMIEVTRT